MTIKISDIKRVKHSVIAPLDEFRQKQLAEKIRKKMLRDNLIADIEVT